MGYKLNKTDGSLLVDLIDGQIDTTSSDLTLIGRNYTGFGEVLNENFIKVLENFANTTAPANPIKGQLWYDSSENKLKIYNGTAFVSGGGTTVATSQPNIVAGDLWIDSSKQQMYFFDGTALKLVGPDYSLAQGTSGWEVISILDTQNQTRTVIKFSIQGSLVGAWANVDFTPVPTQQITELVNATTNPNGAIYKGFNAVQDSFIYRGVVSKAQNLTNAAGIPRTGDQYLYADANDTTTGSITVQNNAGVIVGLNNNTQLKFDSNAFTIENVLTNQDFNLKVRNPTATSAIKVDATNSYVGIFQATPTKTLDVGGDVNISGNLTVSGTQTNISVTNLQVKDKNVELAIDDAGVFGDDTAADQGGIILKSTGGDKSFVWADGTDSWTSSENIDLAIGKTFKVNTNIVLSETTLGSQVVNSSLTNVGTLTALQIDEIMIDGMTIEADSSNASNKIQLKSPQPITIMDSQRITGLGTPADPSDAVTKAYVDGSVSVGIELDISGQGSGTTLWNWICKVLEDLYPAKGYSALSNPTAWATYAQPNGEPPLNTNVTAANAVPIGSKSHGVLARVRTVDYGSGGAVSGINVDGVKLIDYSPVDQTVTAAQRTINAVVTGVDDNSLGQTTKLTMTVSHYYEAGQAVVVTGTTFGAGPVANINGNYTVQAAEFIAESPNYVSLTINLDSSATGLNFAGGNYNANSGTIERTPVVGNANKQVVEDITFSTASGNIGFTPTRTLLQFIVNDPSGNGTGAWEYDRTLTHST